MSYHQPDTPSPNREDSIIREAITIIEHRYCHSALHQTAFTTPTLTKDYLRLRMSGYEREVFAVMLLDSQHRLIAYEELFFGTIDNLSVFEQYQHLRNLPKKRSSHLGCISTPLSNQQPINVSVKEQINDRNLGNLPS